MNKKNLLKLLLVCMLVCFAVSSVFGMQMTAGAEEVVSVTGIAMREGASVRIKTTGDYAGINGIRFTLFINKAYFESFAEPEVGIYVVPAYKTSSSSDMTTEATIPTDAKLLKTDKVTELEGDSEFTTEQTYSFNAVIYDIPENSCNVQLIANGFICEKNGLKTFATNPQTRSIAQVASLCLKNGIISDEIKAYVDNAVTADNFKLDATVTTTLFETDVPSLNAVIPNNLTPIWSSSDSEVATVADAGTLSIGTKVGSTTITATLGTQVRTSVVTVTESGVLLTEANQGDIYNNDIASVFVPSSELSEFTGGYTGNAKKFAIWTNSGFFFNNQYSSTELAAMSERYNRVSMWFAVDNIETGAVVLMTMPDSSLTFKSFAVPGNTAFGSTSNKKWVKYTITLAQYIELVSSYGGDKGRFTYSYAEGLNANSYMYFGNVEFSYAAPGTVIDANSFDAYDNPDIGTTYVPSSELSEFTGGYTGNASRMQMAVNNGYRLLNPYSADELNSIKERYNTVSIWFAIDGIGAGTVRFQDESVAPTIITKAGYNTTVLGTADNKKWTKISISIDDYIALVGNGDGTYVRLACVWVWEFVPVDSVAYLYFGDVSFENLT